MSESPDAPGHIAPNLENLADALDAFAIEVPSWGFANTGTRFGKFLEPSAAHTLEESSPMLRRPIPAYVIDQSHSLKNKLEAVVQTVVSAQELYAKACLVDNARLAKLQQECRLVEAEECLRSAFWTDVRPALRQWREMRGLPADPLQALRESGYVQRTAKERGGKNIASKSSYA